MTRPENIRRIVARYERPLLYRITELEDALHRIRCGETREKREFTVADAREIAHEALWAQTKEWHP